MAAVINFFSEMDFSRPAQPTAHFCPHYTASAVTIEGRLLLKGGYNYREYGTLIGFFSLSPLFTNASVHPSSAFIQGEVS